MDPTYDPLVSPPECTRQLPWGVDVPTAYSGMPIGEELCDESPPGIHAGGHPGHTLQRPGRSGRLGELPMPGAGLTKVT